jgi:hypothetical protein
LRIAESGRSFGTGWANQERSMPDTHLHDLEDRRRHAQFQRNLAAEIVSLLPWDRRQAYAILQDVIDMLQLPTRPPADGPPKVPELPAA